MYYVYALQDKQHHLHVINCTLTKSQAPKSVMAQLCLPLLTFMMQRLNLTLYRPVPDWYMQDLIWFETLTNCCAILVAVSIQREINTPTGQLH